MSENVDFCGRTITVKTLTVRQIKYLIDEFQENDGRVDAIDLLFNDDVPSLAICMATGLSMDELMADVPPRVVKDLIDAVRAENPFFVGMMERLVAVGSSRLTAGKSSGRSAA